MIDKSLLLHAYNRLKFGSKKLDYTDYEFRKNAQALEPTIFLSTGRCGTKWLTERLEKSGTHVPIHHPNPVMRSQAKMMYDYDFQAVDKEVLNLLTEIFLAGREELFVSAKRAGKELAITDSRGTFFAYVISAFFPKAKFVFVHRDPFEFIRSGLKRGWYVLENESELNRIIPSSSNPEYSKWETYSTTKKIAWLWRETNLWIMEFLKTLPKEQQFTIGFNNWNTEELDKMFWFMKADVPYKEISKNLNVRSNEQKKNINPQHGAFTEESKKEAIHICGDLAKSLNYI